MINKNKHLLKLIVSRIREALIVVGQAGDIICINDAALKLLGVPREKAERHYLCEIVLEKEVLKFVQRVFDDEKDITRRISIAQDEGNRLINMSGSFLKDTRHNLRSAMIILNDLTEIEKQEIARREFVSNVMHELKTPVTAIQGAAETLMNGALERPQEALKFVKILERHSERLGDIIEGLLTISKIDQEIETKDAPLFRQPIRPILESAIESCAVMANGKEFSLECDDVEAVVNSLLIERAVVNLLDNALRYAGSGKPIRVRCKHNASETIISVEDSGVGISEEHLPRVFERFYRAGKTRNKSIGGGSGLGLAIVKRIALAHGGYADVKSSPKMGSTFAIHIPHETKKEMGSFDRLTIASQKYYDSLVRQIYLFDQED